MIDDSFFEEELPFESLKVIEKWVKIAKSFVPEDHEILAIKYFDFSIIPYEIYTSKDLYSDRYLILSSKCDIYQKSKYLEILQTWVKRYDFECKIGERVIAENADNQL